DGPLTWLDAHADASAIIVAPRGLATPCCHLDGENPRDAAFAKSVPSCHPGDTEMVIGECRHDAADHGSVPQAVGDVALMAGKRGLRQQALRAGFLKIGMLRVHARIESRQRSSRDPGLACHDLPCFP